MTTKRTPHHDLETIKGQFADANTLEITTTATKSAQKIGFTLEDVVDVVQRLERRDFKKSETAHNPPNSKVWHDTYIYPYEEYDLYLKFAGETLIDVTLVSFKEATE